MADRRCFTKKITESDMFLDMPASTQNLYFHLNLNSCDDDGFVNNPKQIARMVGCNDDDLKLLILKGFVIAFESGVIVIKHWRMHNTLRNDRYHPTSYQEEFKSLGIKDNGSYTLATTWQPNGNHLETEHNITKHNLTEPKEIYGTYSNVKLTLNERTKLEQEYGNSLAEELISYLDEYIEMTGKKYKSHYLVIKKWVVDAVSERRSKTSKVEMDKFKKVDIVPDYSTNNKEVDLSILDNFRKETNG